MSNSLTITKSLDVDHWLIVGELDSGGTLPREIFVYLNTGDNTLGEFYGTCSVNELSRLSIFNFVAIPLFGNKFVRFPQAKIKVALTDNPDSVIATLVSTVKLLSTAYQTVSNTTTVYPIP